MVYFAHVCGPYGYIHPMDPAIPSEEVLLGYGTIWGLIQYLLRKYLGLFVVKFHGDI